MSKFLCVVSCPIDVYSGYSNRSRDFVKSLIKLKGEEWDIRILSQRWGNCPWGYLKANNEQDLLNRIIPQLPKQPDIWVQITVPNEFQPVGKFNIGVTAGIETTICDAEWVLGVNRMNLVLTSSEHSKKVFETSVYTQYNQQKQPVGELRATTPIEVLFEGCNLETYKKLEKEERVEDDLYKKIDEIPESFAFLFVGHWLHGSMGHDRKDVGMLLKVFYETFKNKKNQPALILKTSGAGASLFDKNDIINKINAIKATCKGDLPSVYLLHGELEDVDMNNLYNHPKVKASITFTKGEGFGRPLLEFSMVKKPIIASAWSGQLDFLHPEFTLLLRGKLNKLDPSSVVDKMLLADSEWFTVDYSNAGLVIRDVFENYKNYTDRANRQAYYAKTNFSIEKMEELMSHLLETHLPDFPKPVQIKLPKLKKIEMPKKPTIKSDETTQSA